MVVDVVVIIVVDVVLVVGVDVVIVGIVVVVSSESHSPFWFSSKQQVSFIETYNGVHVMFTSYMSTSSPDIKPNFDKMDLIVSIILVKNPLPSSAQTVMSRAIIKNTNKVLFRAMYLYMRAGI